MTKYIKLIKLFCIILIVVMAIYMLLDIIPMWLYGSDTTGKEITNIEDINICKKIINKKYETILYGREGQLKNLYAIKYYDDIDNVTSNVKLLNDFYMVNINNVYRKFNNVYIVKYIVDYLDNSNEEFTIIIKMNSDKSKAIIVYDDMFN